MFKDSALSLYCLLGLITVIVRIHGDQRRGALTARRPSSSYRSQYSSIDVVADRCRVSIAASHVNDAGIWMF
ncbi:hypothetical protein ICE98_03930 [Lactococcus lactis]|nr:hypothetical protein [Lactococcus lactis]